MAEAAEEADLGFAERQGKHRPADEPDQIGANKFINCLGQHAHRLYGRRRAEPAVL
jgi:hypothetical protein